MATQFKIKLIFFILSCLCFVWNGMYHFHRAYLTVSEHVATYVGWATLGVYMREIL